MKHVVHAEGMRILAAFIIVGKSQLIIMEVASEAVKALLLSCNPNCPISQLADLSDGVIFSDMLLLVEGFRFEK
jgi:hypothetical protein